MKNSRRTNKSNYKGGIAMKMMVTSDDSRVAKRGSRKEALAKQNEKERKHHKNMMSYLYELD